MKKLLNTLYILTPESYLFCQNETIAVKVGGEEKVRIPAHGIESIVCFANTTVSTPFIAFCGERGITLSFHSPYGKFYGRVSGAVSGNVLLRRAQHARHEDDRFTTAFVRLLLAGKLVNSKNQLLRSRREQEEEAACMRLGQAAEQLAQIAAQLEGADSVVQLRGMEGNAAKAYFGAFDDMIRRKSPHMQFERRSRRPPENNVNAALSFLYALLKNDVQSALESVGLDPAVGFLHALRPGRPSLALDIMEELRSPLCDRLVLTLINRGQLQSGDFQSANGGIAMTDKARKMIISAWQERKQDMILHPFLQEKIAVGLIPYTQAMLLARVFRGDLDQYPPFVWR